MMRTKLYILYGRHHKLVDRYEIAISQMNVWVTRRGSYKKQGLLTLGEHLGSPWVFGGAAHLFSFMCFLRSMSCANHCQYLWTVHS